MMRADYDADPKAAALAAAAAAILTAVMLAVAFIGDVFVDEGELREALRDTEDRITEAINDSTEQTNAQMEELRVVLAELGLIAG